MSYCHTLLWATKFPYFLMFGKDPISQFLQPLQDEELDPAATTERHLVFLDARGQAFKQMMPLAMRNLAIA